jgi:16S rRNA (uracil1498-N3)-methyltransferase
MARRRFLVEAVRGDVAELRGDDARRVARVLRAEPGQQYELSDGVDIYLAEVTGVERDQVTFRVLDVVDTPGAPVRLTLFASLIKFDHFEWLVEKATELGVEAVIPVNAARSDKGLLEAAQKRVERWRRIARESTQQARRLRPPEIGEPQSLATALAAMFGSRFFLDEKPGPRALLAALPDKAHRAGADSVALVTGPEGGWTEEERAAAAAAGWACVSLGPLILRAETAAIAAASIITHVWWISQLE